MPLKKFFHKITLNAKVDNWGVELSDYCTAFQCIKGIENTLADILLRLTDHELTEPNPLKKVMSMGTVVLNFT